MVLGPNRAPPRRGVFMSVGAPVDALTDCADVSNEDPKPFVWQIAAEDIIEKSVGAALRSTRSNPRRDTRQHPSASYIVSARIAR